MNSVPRERIAERSEAKASAMGRVAVLGEPVAVQGFGLAGALVITAEGAEAVWEAWRGLPPDVALVVLTAAADAALPARARHGPLTVVMP